MRLEIKTRDFSLNKTLRTQQCPSDFFFQEPLSSGCWKTYVWAGKWVKVCLEQRRERLIVKARPEVDADALESRIITLLGLNREWDLSEFRDDPYIRRLAEEGKGIRVMQDLNKEYRLVAALLTQNTSIKQIKHMQRCLFLRYGDPVPHLGIHGYPDLYRIASASEDELRGCGLGYRASYVREVAHAVISRDFKGLDRLSTKEAREKLMEYRGVGPKVADIILMYGYGRRDAFPMDTRVKRALEREYGELNPGYFGDQAALINLLIFYSEGGDFYNLCLWR